MTKLPSKLRKPKSRVLVVDDHPIIRRGLADLINHEEDLDVCGEATDAHEALDMVATLKPDIALVDISLKELNGIELIKHLKARNSKLPMLVLSMHDETLYAERALRAGARGYVMKQEPPEIVIGAIRKVLNGEIFVSEKMSSRLISRMADGNGDPSGSPLERLSDRELEVFQLIGQGLRTRQIAERLCLSIKTIESYREHIKHKLDLQNSTELFQHALQWVQGQGQ